MLGALQSGTGSIPDAPETSAKLGPREKLSYAGGSVASNLSWNLVAGFLIVYYTDVARLPVGAVGTLVLVARIGDALFDPLAGVLIDRTRSRFGRARPYLLYGALPFAVACVLVFSVPDWAVGARLLYAYLSFAVLGLLYSFLYVPYAALQPMLTADGDELLAISGLRAMGTSIASVVVYALAMPAVRAFGGGGAGYRAASALFAALTAALYLITFRNCRERVETGEARPAVRFGAAVATMVHNPLWLIANGFELLIFLRLGLMTAAMAFYARLVLGSAGAISVLLPAVSLGILAGGIISAPYLRRFGKRAGTVWLLLFTILMFALMPVAGRSLELLVPLLFLGMIGNGVHAATVFLILAEAVALQDRRTGSPSTGLLTAAASFNQKVGFALGSAGLAWGLAAAGYDPAVPRLAVTATLRALFVGVPILVAVLQLACIAFYHDDPATRSCRNAPYTPLKEGFAQP